MKRILQLEELAQAALGICLLHFLPFHFSWWLWPLLFLSPDLGMIGYSINTKFGALVYNIFHHKGLAIAIGVTGWLIGNDWLLLSGILLFSHSSFDRLLGYGLKYNDSFKHTHLDRLNPSK